MNSMKNDKIKKEEGRRIKKQEGRKEKRRSKIRKKNMKNENIKRNSQYRDTYKNGARTDALKPSKKDTRVGGEFHFLSSF